ncbi:hypothetical protein V9T40_013326 [Parthenolecanium corni]|uniref:Uncharacterized protein n=1 Tax=Parthenolecanium corni TaxID=536013 RepID=A0AAN9Y5L3_9HEMI
MFPSPPPPPPPPLMDHRRSLGRENGFDGFTVAVCRLKGREKIETRQSKDESKRIARKKEKRKMKDDTHHGGDCLRNRQLGALISAEEEMDSPLLRMSAVERQYFVEGLEILATSYNRD